MTSWRFIILKRQVAIGLQLMQDCGKLPGFVGLGRRERSLTWQSFLVKILFGEEFILWRHADVAAIFMENLFCGDMLMWHWFSWRIYFAETCWRGTLSLEEFVLRRHADIAMVFGKNLYRGDMLTSSILAEKSFFRRMLTWHPLSWRNFFTERCWHDICCHREFAWWHHSRIPGADITFLGRRVSGRARFSRKPPFFCLFFFLTS